VADVDPDVRVRELAAESLAADDPTGWFERLYVEAEGGAAVIPWDREAPQRLLVPWAREHQPRGDGRRALVVGCGLGADSEFVAGLGFDTVAFDISATAIQAIRRRFPDTPVRYLAADLLDPPPQWHGAFDLVIESLTVQALPDPPRGQAITNVARFVAPGGTLLVIAAGRVADEAGEGPPWPLTRTEIDTFATNDLHPVRVEKVRDAAQPEVFRWRAEFRR
jgi:SAM-dependent methyltransferase